MKSYMGFCKKIFSDMSCGLRPTDFLHPLVNMFKNLKKKFNNLTVVYKGQRFDSISEYIRYKFLLQKETDGQIKNLKRQVKFKLDDKRVYIADFVYFVDKEMVVEDVKSPQLVNKKRFKEAKDGMMLRYNLEIKTISPLRLYKW